MEVVSSPPISESAFSRSQSLKGLRPIDIGSAVGGLLGAAAFFAVDRLMPRLSDAHGGFIGQTGLVLLMDDDMKKLGTDFWTSRVADQDAPGQKVSVTCWVGE